MAGPAKRLWHRLTSNFFSSAGSDIDPPVFPPRDPPDPPGSLVVKVSESETSDTSSRDTINKDSRAPALETSRRIMVNSGSCMNRFCSCPRGYFLVDPKKLPVDYPCVPNGGGQGGCGHTLSDHETLQVSDSGPRDSVPSNIRRLEADPSKVKNIINPYRQIDPKLCPRTDTVAKLWERLRNFRVAHSRATPTSGKTQLARLLEEYVIRNIPEMQVVYLSWPSKGQGYIHKSYDILIKEFANIAWDGLIFDYSNLLLICDEAQNSYPFDTFWNDLVKVQSQGVSTGPYIAMFSSWGSPSPTAVAYDGSAPAYLSPDQRVSISTLYFTRQEFEDVVSRVCGVAEREGPSFRPHPELVDYLFKITSGHPGCTRAVLDVLIHSDKLRPYRQKTQVIDCEAARSVINGDQFFVKLQFKDGFGRSLPPPEMLQTNGEVVPVLREAVLCHKVSGPLEGNPGLDAAYKRGWLHAELAPNTRLQNPEPQYIFPTEVHRWYCREMLVPLDKDFPTEHYNNSVATFCFKAIKKFSSRCLSNSTSELASGGIIRPLEAVYQDELYRSCYQILGSRSYLISEWSPGKKGRIDFYVSGGANWGIECVRDGDRLDEHITRFQPHGLYYDWGLTQHVILDFRTTKPNSLRSYPHLYHVIFTPDFTYCEIFNCRGEEMEAFPILQ